MSTNWDPRQYAIFAHERNRPFADLLARVAHRQEPVFGLAQHLGRNGEAPAPGLVLDLGCGNGPLTLSLAQRWPQARIVGVDSSAQMLRANSTPTGGWSGSRRSWPAGI